MNKINEKLKHIFQIFLPLVLGGIVGFLISGSMDFESLNKPPLAPPGILFPIVWTILYLLMGIAYYLYRKKSDFDFTAKLHYLQLFINLLWPIFFFVLKIRLFSIFWILLLLASIILLTLLYFKKEHISAYLLIPYIIWTIFATYLNIGIYILN